MRIDDYLHESYDNKTSSSLFVELLKSGSDNELAERAMLSTLPVLQKVLCRFRTVKPGTEAWSEVMSSCPMRMYDFLMSDKFFNSYYVDEAKHCSFLFGFFRYEIMECVRRVKKYGVGEVPEGFGFGFDFSTTAAAVETKIYMSELPSSLLEKCLSAVRFPKYASFCELVIKSLISGEGVPYVVLRDVWGGTLTPKVRKFLVEYSISVLRAVIWDMSDDVRSLVKSSSISDLSMSFVDLVIGGDVTSHSNHQEFWFGVDNTESGGDFYRR